MSGPKKERRGLGRGLSALMADVAVPDSPEAVRNLARSVPVEALLPNPDQPRRDFGQAELDSLAASIAEKGIIQPLIVRVLDGSDGKFQIVAGERRWRAAQIAQVHDVPVIIRDLTDSEVLEIAIVENIQRADLNPIEEALGYQQLIDRFSHTQDKIATALGKSRSHIANLLRLLALPADVQLLLRQGQLTMGHARALIPCANASVLAQQVVAQGLSVRETEALAKSDKPVAARKRSAGSSGSEKDADTRSLEGDLGAALGMGVSIDHEPGGESGRVTIRYRTLDQLDDLCQRLSGMA